jgi:hypothetical protein
MQYSACLKLAVAIRLQHRGGLTVNMNTYTVTLRLPTLVTNGLRIRIIILALAHPDSNAL